MSDAKKMSVGQLNMLTAVNMLGSGNRWNEPAAQAGINPASW